MKYSPETYAKALASAIAQLRTEEERNVAVERFLDLVKKNGDSKKLPKIVASAEKIFCKHFGLRKVLIESARPIKDARILFKNFIRTGDFMEEAVNPELIAGVRITMNGEFIFDESLKGKLDKIFK